MTLNMAHGRRESLNQMLLPGKAIHRNLEAIAKLIRQENPDLVALQEADGPSAWSGRFDHVAELAALTEYPFHLHTVQARSLLFQYGTALLSRAPFQEALGHGFRASPPTMSKGFSLGQVLWKPPSRPGPPLHIDVVSVHLDFSRRSVRSRQIEELKTVLSQRANPTIVMGDFNSDWFTDENVVQALVTGSRLRAYRPGAPGMGTYVSSDRRLDWILISDDLEYIDYRVLETLVSDHRAIVATLGLRN